MAQSEQSVKLTWSLNPNYTKIAYKKSLNLSHLLKYTIPKSFIEMGEISQLLIMSLRIWTHRLHLDCNPSKCMENSEQSLWDSAANMHKILRY